MKKLVNKLLSFVFVSAMCIISLQLPIHAQDSTIEEAVQSEVESQTLNLQDQIQEPTLINEFSYVNLNESIIKKTLSEEEKQNKTEEEIIELEKQLGYEYKKIDLEAPYTKTQLNEELPKSIKAQTDSEEIEIPITWKLDNIEEEIKDGIYTLTSTIPEDYKLSDTISNHDIELTVLYKKVEEKQQDNIQENNNDLTHIDNPVNTSNNIVTAFDIKWVNPSNNEEIEDTEIVMEAQENDTETKVRAELSFAVSQANIEKGKIEIRLPEKLFTNRDNEKQGYYKIGIKDNLSYEVKEDENNNEIIITNELPITDAHTLKVQIDYYDSDPGYSLDSTFPSHIVNNSIHKLKAKYSIDLGTEIITDETKEIQVKHIIDTRLDYPRYYGENKVSWDSSWGEKPEDSIFIQYEFSFPFEYTPATMPYRLTLQKEGSYKAYPSNENYDGRVILWEVTGLTYEDPNIYEIDNKNGLVIENFNKDNDFYHTINIKLVVSYPKSSLGEVANITEKLTATLTPYYEDDGDSSQVMEEYGGYRYETIEFKYPPGNYDIDKNSNFGRENDRNYVEKVKGAIDKIKLVDNNTPVNFEGYANVATVWGGTLTLKEDGNSDVLEDYEKREYTMEAYDDLMILDGERLLADDYSFPSVTIGDYKYYTVIQNEDTGGAEYKEITNHEEKQPIDIYYSTSIDDDKWEEKWIKYATVRVSAENDYIVTYMNGKTSESRGEVKILLPEHTVGVKAITKSKRAKTQFNLDVEVNLYGTEHLRKIMKDLEADNMTSIDLYNVSTIVVKDSNGNWVNDYKPNSITGSLEDIVAEHDKKIYGENYRAQHDDHKIRLQSLEKRSLLNKTIDTFKTNSSSSGYYYAECLIDSHNLIEYDDSMFAKEDFKKYNLILEESHGKIYDLLPMGAFIDETTIKSGYARHLGDDYTVPFAEIKNSKVSIEYFNNWRNSGRTMVVFDIKLPDDYDNIYFNTFDDYCDSSLAVQFDIIYPYESVTDYGINLRNLAAYESENELFSGLPDNADNASFKDIEKEWFTDINNDGITGNLASKNMLYTVCNQQLSDPTAAEIKFSKEVKNNSDLDYRKSTDVIPDENYSYKVRIGSENNLDTKDIVLFDVLESAYEKDEANWKGALESIDVSQPIANGVKPVIYYSSNPDIQLNNDDVKNLSGNANIKDESIWTTTMPADKSKITAIAVDMRAKDDSTDFVLDSNKTLVVIVNMKAPNSGISEYEKKKAKAYNDAWLSNSVKLENNNVYEKNAGLCNRTDVSIRSPNISISKSSDPESGTETIPTIVEEESNIIYDVSIYNREKSNTLYNIVSEDKIPTGLEIDFDNIKYYYNYNESSAKLVNLPDDGISVERDKIDSRKLIFKIDELKGYDKIHFLIPTKVESTGEPARYENQAFITKVGKTDVDIPSETTYHEKVIRTTFAFNKTDKSLENYIEGAGFALYEKRCDHNHNDRLNVDESGNLGSAPEVLCWERVKDHKITGSYNEFNNLRTDKEYRLVEYKAPDGYAKPTGQWILKFNKTSNEFDITTIGNPPAFVDPTSGTKATDTTLKLPNYTIEELPTTGGRGILRYMMIGTPVMMIGGYLIIRNIRKKA